MRIRNAMLFAAGLGTRMRPLTDHTPKPLIRVAGRALLDYALDRFEAHGVRRVVVNTHYLAAHIAEHLAGQRRAMEVVLSHEPVLLETGGGLVQALPLLGDEPFFSTNADAFWCDPPGHSTLAELEAAFDPARLDALLVLAPRAHSPGYHGPGNFSLEAGALRWDGEGHVFTGLQIVHPRWLAGRAPVPFSLRELYRVATDERGVLQRVGGLLLAGDFMHVGSPEELREVEAALAGARPLRSARAAT
jgi:N-acetyl-alpha-D-muramate 1-phosphate uridylyltransferase